MLEDGGFIFIGKGRLFRENGNLWKIGEFYKRRTSHLRASQNFGLQNELSTPIYTTSLLRSMVRILLT